MKLKSVLVLTLLVMVSLISFSNKCKPSCDGRTMIVMSSQETEVAEEKPTYETAVETSPLLRIAVTL